MKWKSPWIALLVIACLGAGLREKKKPAEKPTAESLPAGYALLFKLMGDEKDVSKLLIVKKERSELHDVIKQISDAAGRAHKDLEKRAKRSGLNLEDQELPPIEVAARESISKEKAKQLLGAKGEDFEVALLMAQHEALTYAIHLIRVLVEAEANTERKEFLGKTEREFEPLRENVYRMLMRNHSPLEPEEGKR